MTTPNANPSTSEHRTTDESFSQQPAAPSTNGQPARLPASEPPTRGHQRDTLEHGAAQQAHPVTQYCHVVGRRPANAAPATGAGASPPAVEPDQDTTDPQPSVQIGTTKLEPKTYETRVR